MAGCGIIACGVVLYVPGKWSGLPEWPSDSSSVRGMVLKHWVKNSALVLSC